MFNVFAVLILVAGYFFYRWWFRHTWDNGAPYEGMPPDVVENALRLANVGPKDTLYDLGSGDGRVVIAAAMKGAKATGIEIDKLRVLYSRLWIKMLRLGKNAKVIRGDVFDAKISDATVVCCYLLPDTHGDLKKKFKKELKKGTRIIAVGFEIEGWKPKKIDPDGPVYGPIFLYTV